MVVGVSGPRFFGALADSTCGAAGGGDELDPAGIFVVFCFGYILFDYIVLHSIRFGSIRLYHILFGYIIFGYVWILVYYIRF